MNKIKIIFLDLDGTLLNDKKTISFDDIETLNICSKQYGIKIGYVTSRTKRNINKLISGLPCDFISCYNGATIEIFHDGKTVRRIAGGIKDEIGDFLLGKLHPIFADRLAANFEPYNLWDSKIKLNDVFVCHIDKKNTLENLPYQRLRIYKVTDDELITIHNIVGERAKIYRENNDVIIEDFNVNKRIAVELLLAHYNMNSQNAMAIGNGTDDIGMIKYCNYGVAMSNAEKEVLSSAKIITATNNNSGVSEVIKKFVLE